MPKRESWSDAYRRILAEVKAEMPDAADEDQFEVYRLRCQQWKAERGIR